MLAAGAGSGSCSAGSWQQAALGGEAGGAPPCCTATGLGKGENRRDEAHFCWSCFRGAVQRGSWIQHVGVEKRGC